jgi:hypothetical protein
MNELGEKIAHLIVRGVISIICGLAVAVSPLLLTIAIVGLMSLTTGGSFQAMMAEFLTWPLIWIALVFSGVGGLSTAIALQEYFD